MATDPSHRLDRRGFRADLLRTQDALVDLGHHRGPSVVDLLVAATAEAWGLTILHVDADFDTIAGVADVHTVRADKI